MDAGMWLVSSFFKIEYWFREASQNLSLFRQLFFHGLQWGTKGKMLKKTMNSLGNFSAFFLWSPVGNHDKKNILSWKTWKRVTFRHPYLRILFPFVKFFVGYLGKFKKQSKRHSEISWPLELFALFFILHIGFAWLF